MKKILITGGAGKIGAHFVRKHATEYNITVADIQTSPAIINKITANFLPHPTPLFLIVCSDLYI